MSSVSVVTNALRLRSFRQPSSAQAILHPSVRARISEFAYLLAIGLVALGVGAAALTFARSDPAMAAMSATAPASSSVQPDRTIAISTSDQLRFAPGALSVRAGETVAFEISNPGALPHEFTIGDQSVQQEHEQEMANGSSTGIAQDAAFSINVPAGQSARLVYTFQQPGTLEYGCHVPGHYAAGMLGTITVNPS